MGVKLVSASAGSVEIVAPTTASNFTATMPATTGTVMVQTATGSSIASGTKYQVNGTTVSALAWINLNLSSGTTVIRSSYNITSATRSATGKFTLTFTTALSDANYSVLSTSGNTGSTATTNFVGTALATSTSYNSKTTSVCEVWVLAGNNSAFVDAFDVNITIFGN